MATTIDELQVLITAQTDGLRREVSKVDSQLSGLSKITGRQTESMSDSFSRVGKHGVRTLQYGVVAAVGAIAASIPGAVRRIDTLVAFPRVLEAMGATSEQAAKSTQTLSDRLTGLPTPLQEGAAGVQALVAAGLEVEGATDVFLAFNNATLAASTEAGAAQGAFTQLVQSISKGKIEGEEWNSMVAAMPTAFQALSKESGLTREELRELYRTDPQKLLDDLVKLDKEGGGGLASLEEQARAATGGIGTAFDNMKNAITRGLEGIVRQMGNGDLEAGQKKISDAITAIGSAFGDALEKVGDLVSFVMKHGDIFGPLAAGIGIVIGLITAWTIAQGILNAVMAINPIALLIIAIAGLVTGLVIFFTQTETGQAIWAAFTEFMGAAWEAITGFFIGAWDAIKGVWDAVVGFFQGVWDGIVSTFTSVGSWFKGVFQGAWDGIKGIWSAVTGWFGNVWNGIKNIFNAVVGFYSGIFSGAWSAIKGIWSAVTGWFSGVWNGIKGVFSGVGDWFRSTFQAGWNSITSIFGKIRSYFSDRLNDIKSVFSPSALIDSGRALIDGLVKGISKGFSAAKNFVADKMADLRGLFPFSPAKEGPFSGMGYTTHSGKALMEDFAKGIGDNAAKARKAAMQAVSGVQGVMSADLAGLSSGRFDSSKRVLGAYSNSFNANMPTAAQLSSNLDIGMGGKVSLADMQASKRPLYLMVDGKVLGEVALDSINDRAFLSNVPILNI